MMDAEFCFAALADKITAKGLPAEFNTDQGGQFGTAVFIDVLDAHA